METIIGDYRQQAQDYQVVERAIQYLSDHYREQPELKEIAASVNLSEYHFQRLFTRWVGVSPKRFLQYLTKERARRLLEQCESLLSVSYETGLSGPGRLHDLFVTWEAVSPGEYKSRGEGLEIDYGFHPSPFGECLLAVTTRGVCGLEFIQNGDRSAALAELKRRWPKAVLHENPTRTQRQIACLFTCFEGGDPQDLALHVWGTPFQLKVWEALLRIPTGAVLTYEDIAVQIGLPQAARAVGTAIGRNPVPVLIPCHRVIRRTGDLGGYRWGAARKKALLGWEFSRTGEVHSDALHGPPLSVPV
jgi:AraC family transcriptional regulator of adaptative response/methylated-DNA-[protein]-cysteine methyltransferase